MPLQTVGLRPTSDTGQKCSFLCLYAYPSRFALERQTPAQAPLDFVIIEVLVREAKKSFGFRHPIICPLAALFGTVRRLPQDEQNQRFEVPQ